MTYVPMVRTWLGPVDIPGLATTLSDHGAQLVGLNEEPEVIVWTEHAGVADLREILARTASVRLVQLPAAGIDDFIEGGALERRDVQYATCRGAFAVPVAEHALALALSALRGIPERARARKWGVQGGDLLRGKKALIVGAGGVGSEVARLLRAFGASPTLVGTRTRSVEVAGEPQQVRVVDELLSLLPAANLVVLACPLTPQTRGLIGPDAFASIRPGSYLINVGRGAVVQTDALVAALQDGTIRRAALDVTDPEPLPSDHVLWTLDNVLITPHTADTLEMITPLFISRAAENVERDRLGQPLVGEVSLDDGY
ncbi:NAD(P)-dependent oxidoreductase [Pseudactinotalea sp. Z1748]|uniref:NAD(P)-dependent oxidoreductase n=1 Tax=Pseudactinotalea sp. Z1748 TaxID=3413027 RepID=UPI003C7E5615